MTPTLFVTVTVLAKVPAQATAEPPSTRGDEPALYTPEVPRAWDDDALRTMELPLVSARHTPRHVSSDYYYAMPTLDVFRTYPIYHLDDEPPGYWEWLHEQEPELSFDREQLRTKEDWIRAGEAVFWDGEYQTGKALEFVRDPDAVAALGIRYTSDGRYPYARYMVRQRGKVGVAVFSCGSCHTRVLPDGTLLAAGPSDQPLGAMLAYESRQSSERSPHEASAVVDRQSIDYRFAAAPWMQPDPGAYSLGKTALEVADLMESLPPGVFVRNRTSYPNPVRTPDLIGLEQRDYLDATGLVQQRSIGDLMRYTALNQELDELGSYDGFRPRASDFATLPDPETQARLSDDQLFALALYLYSLEPPANPNPIDDSVKRGQALFRSERCDRCHPAPLYSNNQLVPAVGFEPPRGHRQQFAVSSSRIGTDPGLTLRTRRGTGYYKVPSLRGAWYRGPFFHDGSLAELEDVFDPERLESDYLPTGFRGPKATRRSVQGHEFGLDLSAEDRADLIAFLRSL